MPRITLKVIPSLPLEEKTVLLTSLHLTREFEGVFPAEVCSPPTCALFVV